MRSFKALLAIVLLTPLVFTQAQTAVNKAKQGPRSTPKKDIQITWLGHAAFEIVSSEGTRILIDPFLKENPATPAEFKTCHATSPTLFW